MAEAPLTGEPDDAPVMMAASWVRMAGGATEGGAPLTGEPDDMPVMMANSCDCTASDSTSSRWPFVFEWPSCTGEAAPLVVTSTLCREGSPTLPLLARVRRQWRSMSVRRVCTVIAVLHSMSTRAVEWVTRPSTGPTVMRGKGDGSEVAVVEVMNTVGAVRGGGRWGRGAWYEGRGGGRGRWGGRGWR